MTVLCLGALLAGLIAASLLPFLPFAGSVLIAILIGWAAAIAGGVGFGRAALSALALLLACQIGYGLGLVATAVVGHGVARWRLGGGKGASPSARSLRTGNGPR